MDLGMRRAESLHETQCDVDFAHADRMYPDPPMRPQLRFGAGAEVSDALLEMPTVSPAPEHARDKFRQHQEKGNRE